MKTAKIRTISSVLLLGLVSLCGLKAVAGVNGASAADLDKAPNHASVTNRVAHEAGLKRTSLGKAIALNPAQLSPAGISKGQFEFSFPTVSGLRYQVEFSSDLHTWKPTGRPIVGTGQPITLSSPMQGRQGFFRLNIRPNTASPRRGLGPKHLT